MYIMCPGDPWDYDKMCNNTKFVKDISLRLLDRYHRYYVDHATIFKHKYGVVVSMIFFTSFRYFINNQQEKVHFWKAKKSHIMDRFVLFNSIISSILQV